MKFKYTQYLIAILMASLLGLFSIINWQNPTPTVAASTPLTQKLTKPTHPPQTPDTGGLPRLVSTRLDTNIRADGHAIATDSNGIAYVAYYKHGGGLHLTQWEQGVWQTEMISATNTSYRYVSLDVDSDGHPHLLYYNSAQTELLYTQWHDDQWHTETVTTTTVDGYLQLTLDSQDVPHILYGNNDDEIHYYVWRNDVWQHTTIFDPPSSPVWGGIDMALDSQDHPHIVYTKPIEDIIVYTTWDGTNWHSEEVPSQYIWLSGFISLIVNQDDVPYMAYTTSDQKVGTPIFFYYGFLANRHGGTWTHNNFRPNSTIYASDNRIMHSIYYDDGDNDLYYLGGGRVQSLRYTDSVNETRMALHGEIPYIVYRNTTDLQLVHPVQYTDNLYFPMAFK